MRLGHVSRLLATSVLAAGCATARRPPAEAPAVPADSPVQAILIEDSLHGARYELPPAEGGWQSAREGAEVGGGIQVEVGGFPLAKSATPTACRETARARLAQGHKPPKDEAHAGIAEGRAPGGDEAGGLREQVLADAPTASWSFTRGGPAPVRSRWAFFARGPDCVLLEVTGAKDDAFGDQVFVKAARTFQLVPLAPERQRELDLLAGMGFLERREPAAALERFEALSKREPAFAKARFGALMAAFEIGPAAYPRGLAHGEAVLSAERELSSDQRQLALRAMGVIQLAQNRLQGAASTLAELVVRAPDLAEGQYNYACALARLGNPDGALSHLRAAVRLDESLAAHARTDDDLAALRSLPEFERALREADANR